ncbi:MAG: nuclear transport factor 2 family protein [Terriglobales bacterium]
MKKSDIERRLAEYRDALRSMQTDAWVSQFAEDGSVEDPVGMPAHRGHEALRTFFDGVRKNFKLLDLTPELVVVAPPEAVVKWSTRGVTAAGAEITFQGVSTYTFREDGKVQQMRAFWDVNELGRLLKAAAAAG